MSMKKLLHYITKVNYATNRTKSLKTGFPKEISEILNVKAEDSIEWCVNLCDEKIVITVQKHSENKDYDNK